MNNKAKVLLVSILQHSHRNLSVLSLYTYLKKHDVNVNLLFLPKNKEFETEEIKSFIVEYRFNIIGISVMTENFNFATQITHAVKTASPQVKIIWGGIHPTLMPEECLKHADGICRGEGEAPFMEMIRKFNHNCIMSDIKGMGFKNTQGHPIINPPSVLIRDLDSLPAITFDWDAFFIQDKYGLRPFGKKEYIQYSNYSGEDYTLMTSRSCPFSCAYCCNAFINALYGAQKTFRKRSVDHVIGEIKAAIQNIGNIKFINFIDDQFYIHQQWNDEFCRAYKDEISLPFIIRLKPGTFSEEDIKKLKGAGLKFVQIGLQSGSETTNKEIFNRSFNKKELLETSQIFSKYQIIPFYDVIIQNDLETDEDRDKTIELLFELEKPFKCILFALTPFPKTELERIYRERGITSRTDPYDTGYVNYNEEDVYFQLATIIPYTSRNICRYLFDNKTDEHAQNVLKGYFQWSRHLSDRKHTVAQKTGR